MSLTPRDQSIVKTVARAARKRFDELNGSLSSQIKALSDQLAELRLNLQTLPAPERGEKGDKGDPGGSVTAEDVLPALETLVKKLDAQRPIPRDGINGKDGQSVTLEDIKPLIESHADRIALDVERRTQDILQRAIDRIPSPRDGIDGKDADPELVAAKVIERLDLKGTRTDLKKLCAELVTAEVAKIESPKDGRDGKDGSSVEVSDVLPAVKDQVAEFLAALEPPKDGRDGADGESVTLAEVLPVVKGQVSEFLSSLEPPKDGRDGESVTLADIEPLLKSMHAEWALGWEQRAQGYLEKAVDRMPKAKDGKDGVSFKDFSWEFDGERTLTAKIKDGEGEREQKFVLPIVIDQGVHDEKREYSRGDGTTWGGSFWIAQIDRPEGRPGQFSKGWRLAVKKGRDGGSK